LCLLRFTLNADTTIVVDNSKHLLQEAQADALPAGAFFNTHTVSVAFRVRQ